MVNNIDFQLNSSKYSYRYIGNEILEGIFKLKTKILKKNTFESE